jgi:hypothetical protein
MADKTTQTRVQYKQKDENFSYTHSYGFKYTIQKALSAMGVSSDSRARALKSKLPKSD